MAHKSPIWKKEFHLRRQRPPATPEGAERTESTSMWKRDVHLFPLRFADAATTGAASEPPAAVSPLAPAPALPAEQAGEAAGEPALVAPGDAAGDPWFASADGEAASSLPGDLGDAVILPSGRSPGAEKISEWLAAAAAEVVPPPTAWQVEPDRSQEAAEPGEPDEGSAVERPWWARGEEAAAPSTAAEDEFAAPAGAQWFSVPAAEVSTGWPATPPFDVAAPRESPNEPPDEQSAESALVEAGADTASPDAWRADDQARHDDASAWTDASPADSSEHDWTPLSASADEPEPASAAEHETDDREPATTSEWAAEFEREPAAAEPAPPELSSPWGSSEPAAAAPEWPVAPRLDMNDLGGSPIEPSDEQGKGSALVEAPSDEVSPDDAWWADDRARLDDASAWTQVSPADASEHAWTPLTAYTDEPEPASAVEHETDDREPATATGWAAEFEREPAAAEPEPPELSSPWGSPEPAPAPPQWPAIAPIARLDEPWAESHVGGTPLDAPWSEPGEPAESPWWSDPSAEIDGPARDADGAADPWQHNDFGEREQSADDDKSLWSLPSELSETESQEPSFSPSIHEPAPPASSSPWLSDVSESPDAAETAPVELGDAQTPWSAEPREPGLETDESEPLPTGSAERSFAADETAAETPASPWLSPASLAGEREPFSPEEIGADDASPWSGGAGESSLEPADADSSSWSGARDGDEENESATEFPAGEALWSRPFDPPGAEPTADSVDDLAQESMWSAEPAASAEPVAENEASDAAGERSPWDADPAFAEPDAEASDEEPAGIAAFAAEVAAHGTAVEALAQPLDSTAQDDVPEPSEIAAPAVPPPPSATIAPATGPKVPVWRREIKLPRLSRQSSGQVAGGELVGLRIGSTGLGAALVQNGPGTPELLQLAHAPLDRGVVVAGEVREPDALAAALRDFFAANKLPRRSVRLGIASNRIGVRVLDVPAIGDPKLLENAIRFRAQELLSIPINDAVLDHVVLGESVGPDGPTRRVLVAFAHRELIDRYVEACKKARIRLIGVDFDAFALLRAVSEPPEASDQPGQATVAVSIGHERTIFAVAEGGVCDFTRVLEWGGASLDVGLARTLNLAPSEAGTIKHGLSLSGDEQADGLSPLQAEAARVAMRTELQVLARELLASLQFYQSRPGSLAIGEILLTGGGAQLAGTSEELERRLGVPVRVANPFRRITLGKRVAPPALPGSLSIAIGLGMEGA